MSGETRNHLEHVLENVKTSRREALKRLLVGGGVLAVLPPVSVALAQGGGRGKGEGGGRGRGKGEGPGTETGTE